MDHIFLEATCRHMDDREVVKRQPHGFVEGKSHLTDPLFFCDAAVMVVEKGKATIVMYLGFFKSFKVVPLSICLLSWRGVGLVVWWADLGWLPDAHQATLSPPRWQDTGRKYSEKFMR